MLSSRLNSKVACALWLLPTIERFILLQVIWECHSWPACLPLQLIRTLDEYWEESTREPCVLPKHHLCSFSYYRSLMRNCLHPGRYIVVPAHEKEQYEELELIEKTNLLCDTGRARYILTVPVRAEFKDYASLCHREDTFAIFMQKRHASCLRKRRGILLAV